jgi:hypothetical protein
MAWCLIRRRICVHGYLVKHRDNFPLATLQPRLSSCFVLSLRGIASRFVTKCILALGYKPVPILFILAEWLRYIIFLAKFREATGHLGRVHTERGELLHLFGFSLLCESVDVSRYCRKGHGDFIFCMGLRNRMLARRMYTRVYLKVSGLVTWRENCTWYSPLPLGAAVSLFSESV